MRYQNEALCFIIIMIFLLVHAYLSTVVCKSINNIIYVQANDLKYFSRMNSTDKLKENKAITTDNVIKEGTRIRDLNLHVLSCGTQCP